MVLSLHGVHKSHVVQIWVHLKEMFPKVLRGLQVLQVAGNVLAGYELFTLGRIAVVT